MAETSDSVYVAYLPNSPTRHVFKEFKELRTFLDSPENKMLNTSARFKKCRDLTEADSFIEDINSLCDSLNSSSLSSSSSGELRAPYAEPKPPLLNQFRKAIESEENEKFQTMLEDNPRLIVNTSSDLPTVLQGSQRHNVMHVACMTGNAYVVQRVLELLGSQDFLQKAYGDAYREEDELKDHLLDAFINTPDKNANNTPLHFASRSGHAEIVLQLVSFRLCMRRPTNRFKQTPIDLVCTQFKGSVGDKADAKIAIMRLLREGVRCLDS